MPTEERVLCFERKLLDKLGIFQGLSREIERYLPSLTATSQTFYLNRSEAEVDKRYKQLIPYVLIVCNDRILRYRRGKGGQAVVNTSRHVASLLRGNALPPGTGSL